MTQPNGFSMSFGPGYPAPCDLCTASITEDRIRTFVGEIPVSNLCTDCADDIAKIALRSGAKVRIAARVA